MLLNQRGVLRRLGLRGLRLLLLGSELRLRTLAVCLVSLGLLIQLARRLVRLKRLLGMVCVSLLMFLRFLSSPFLSFCMRAFSGTVRIDGLDVGVVRRLVRFLLRRLWRSRWCRGLLRRGRRYRRGICGRRVHTAHSDIVSKHSVRRSSKGVAVSRTQSTGRGDTRTSSFELWVRPR